MIQHYLTIALRGLMKYKWQNVVCIAGLTIGFTAFVLGGYWWYWERHFDVFHPESRYIYAITTTNIAQSYDGSAIELDQIYSADAKWMLENIPEIEKYTFTNWAHLRTEKDNLTVDLMGLSVDSVFFRMFYNEFIYGDCKHVPFDGSHIVLTEQTALKYFGKTDCAGELFPVENKKVAGVIRNYPENSGFRFEFLTLSRSVIANQATFYVQLSRNTRINEVREKVEKHQSVAQTRRPGEEKTWSFNMRTLPEIHLYCRPELKSRFRNIQLLAIAGLLGLISALMNHLLLFIGQQQKRQRRYNMFRCMGASTTYLFVKSLVDLVIPLAFALVASLLLLRLLFPYYQSYAQWQGYGIYKNYFSKPELKAMLYTTIQWTGYIVVFFLTAGSLVIAGLVRKTGKRSPSLLRHGLIVSQVFIGSVFLFVALSLFKQFHFTQNRDRGLRVDNIIQINAGGWSRFDHPTMKEELLRSPFIEDVTFTTVPVITELGGHYTSYITQISYNDERYNDIRAFVVEPNFLDFFGMKMKEGEWMLSETDVVMNEAQMQVFGDKDLIGQTIQMPFLNELKISGILCNYNHSTMQYPAMRLVFHLYSKNSIVSYAYAYIKTKPENRASALEHVQQTLETQQITEVLEGSRFIDLTEVMNGLNRPERMLSLIFGVLSLACILVVSFGVYALVSLTIEQRRKEIAIRKVNGAEFADMLRLFFREYLLLVAIGNMFALTLGYFLMLRWFETYAYRTALSWWLFVLTLATTGIIVFLSVVSKIKEAARIEPVEALKE